MAAEDFPHYDSTDEEVVTSHSRPRPIPEQIRSAIEILWEIYRRQSVNGAANEEVCPSPEIGVFAKNIVKKPGFLLGLCKHFETHPSLQPRDAKVLGELLALADALSVAYPSSFDDTLVFEISGPIDRSEYRTEIAQPAQFRFGVTQCEVKLRNLSARGVMIEGATDVSVGDQVSIQIGEIGYVPSSIAWSIEDRCGLAFSHSIDIYQSGFVLG